MLVKAQVMLSAHWVPQTWSLHHLLYDFIPYSLPLFSLHSRHSGPLSIPQICQALAFTVPYTCNIVSSDIHRPPPTPPTDLTQVSPH